MVMTPNQLFSSLQEQVSQLLPDAAKSAQEELHSHIRAVVNNALTKLDVVTREEFDIQAEVLQRTRMKLEALEATVARLEQQLAEENTDKPVK